jgi:hypothetical protein
MSEATATASNAVPVQYNIWVPEKFYQRFIANREANTSLLQKLAAQEPQPRGAPGGLSRNMQGLTHEEWNELYVYAAEARANQRNIHKVPHAEFKAETLNAAISGANVAKRMEKHGGLDELIEYTPKFRKNTKDTEETEGSADEGNTSEAETEAPTTEVTDEATADAEASEESTEDEDTNLDSEYEAPTMETFEDEDGLSDDEAANILADIQAGAAL